MLIILKNFHEREFHPFLNIYLNKILGIAGKTIFQEKSTNTTKGENEWIHPDMVGFNLPTSNWNEKVVNMCDHYHIPKVIIYSFELKKEITMSSLREDYFQTVSNSSWANEGYLVATKIDTNDEKLMQKMNRLCSAFGIGIILLNLQHPEKSKILFEAIRKENIDGETVNHLFEINQDFREFLKSVENSLKINSIVRHDLDELKSKKELEEILNKAAENDKEPFDESINEIDKPNTLKEFDWNSSVTGKKPKSLMIQNETIFVTSWKDILIYTCNFFIKNDKQKFENVAKILKGKKRPYFSKNKEELRVPYSLENVDYFVEVNLSADYIIKLVKELILQYGYKEKEIHIFIEKN